jgi:hypothetical protein
VGKIQTSVMKSREYTYSRDSCDLKEPCVEVIDDVMILVVCRLAKLKSSPQWILVILTIAFRIYFSDPQYVFDYGCGV